MSNLALLKAYADGLQKSSEDTTVERVRSYARFFVSGTTKSEIERKAMRKLKKILTQPPPLPASTDAIWGSQSDQLQIVIYMFQNVGSCTVLKLRKPCQMFPNPIRIDFDLNNGS